MSEPELEGGEGSGLRRDTAVVTACTLVSRLTGFGRVLATAAVLGSGVLADVYQTANLIPNLLFELVAGGVLQAVLVPSYVAARRAGGDAALADAVRATNAMILACLGIVSVLGMALSPLIARLMVLSEPSAAVSAEKLDVMVPMVLVFVPQLVFYGLAMAVSAALNARGRFVAAALAPAVNNLIVIVACVLFRAARDGETATLDLTPWQFALLAGGTTLGVIAFSVTPTLALRRMGVQWWPRWQPGHAAVRLMRQQFGWATLSIVGTLVPTATALALGNGAPGGVAVFVYAFAFYVLPHALIAVPVATTLAPRAAESWQAGDAARTRDAVDTSIRIAVPLLVLGGAGMVALAWPVARLVGNIGQTASQGLAPIAHTLAVFGPGLLGYGVAFVATRVLFSIGDVRQASLLMIAGAVVGVAGMALASTWMAPAERAAALALGYGAAQTVTAVLLVVRVHELTGALRPRVVLRILGEAVLAGVVGAVVMLGIVARFGSGGRQALFALLVGGTCGVVAFAGVALLSRYRAVREWLLSRGSR